MTLAERRTRHVVIVDNSALAKRIGERIRIAREAAGLTQKQLAGDRFTPAYVSALERGLAKPSLASMSFLAPRLGIRLADLVDDGQPGRPPGPGVSVDEQRDVERIQARLPWASDVEALYAVRTVRMAGLTICDEHVAGEGTVG